MGNIHKETALSKGSRWSMLAGVVSLFVLLLAVLVHGTGTTYAASTTSTPVNAAVSSSDWSTYLFNKARAGYNHYEKTITASNAANLKLHWSVTAGGGISSQPIEANGTVYWGSWDGDEHATNLSGGTVWSTNLGQTTDTSCNPKTAGVASTATVAPFVINNVATSVDFVGGGNAQFYALNAKSGAVIWHTSLGMSPSHFIWDSPLVYNGSVYIGVSSFGDCPLVQGQFFQLNAKTGAIQHTFNVVPSGCLGGGIWGSPTLDSSANTLYFATGNANSCSSSDPYAEAVIELRTTDLSLVGSWQIPANQMTNDGDFGSTPTLFTGNGQNLVGIADKNGIYYALKRDALGSGPVWQTQVANAGDCPQCGSGSVSPSAWDGNHLFVAGGNTTINGTSYKGSLRELSPASGKILWQVGLNGAPVLSAVTVIPGVAIVTQATNVLVFATASGQILKTLSDTGSGSLYYGAASVSNGIIYAGNMDDKLYAYGL